MPNGLFSNVAVLGFAVWAILEPQRAAQYYIILICCIGALQLARILVAMLEALRLPDVQGLGQYANGLLKLHLHFFKYPFVSITACSVLTGIAGTGLLLVGPYLFYHGFTGDAMAVLGVAILALPLSYLFNPVNYLNGWAKAGSRKALMALYAIAEISEYVGRRERRPD